MYLGSAFLLFWMIILLPFARACLEAERSYLLDFKAGLNLSLSSARFLSSWQGFNCCEWEGVVCDYYTSHVIRLDVSSYDQGFDTVDAILVSAIGESDDRSCSELRPSLFNLQSLQYLDLSGNDFQGTSIPSQFSKLQKLTFLGLSYAGFAGEVPLELGNISSLRYLHMSSNCLSSNKFDVWVRNLRSLEFLAMNGVNLTMASEHWGEALSGLSNLTQIYLYGCELSGNIPDLSNLTRLSHLHLGSNSFPFELPSWFENVSSLVSLDLDSCGLDGYIPPNFMSRSRMSNLVLDENSELKGNLSVISSHSSSLVVLSLFQCNLGGTLHPIANFSNLKTINLAYNNLVGSIPSSFGNFSSLETLDRINNSLEGSIPSSFGNFSSLVSLDLSYNKLIGHIPPSLCKLPTLRELVLDHNQLSGTIPNSISDLEVLSLSSNRLRGKLSLQLLENLTRLREFHVSQNQLFINISTSWVPQFSHLAGLGLRSCNIEGDLPAFLSQQNELERLDLSDNNMVGNLPLWLWDLPYLQYLNLSNNQLEGCLPDMISHGFEVVDLHNNRLYGSLPALDFASGILDLSDNEFNGSIPATDIIPSCLSLSGNNLTGQIPSSICFLQGSFSYDVLDLSKNKLLGMIPANIGRCSQLSILNLAQNILQGEVPEELGNLNALRTLDLNGNKLQGIIPSSIANCTDLQVFDLGNNKFEGSIPLWIERLTELRIFSLPSNKFIDRIPAQLFSMQNLQILDLSGNQLSGSIPPDVANLYAMVNSSQIFDIQYSQYSQGSDGYASYEFKFVDEVTMWIKGRAAPYEKIIRADKFIDLSRNKLSGNIPSKLGLLAGLISLNISRNNLSGSIPESLGAMSYLESLDLSENKLSGNIPSQLLNLTFLEVLNLSDNMLFGLIPQGKQFSTFEASSFLGNPNLHGPPLEIKTLSNGSISSGKNHNNTCVDEDGDADVDVVMEQWWAVGVGLSYGVGFAIVIALLCFHIKWRYLCFSLMDSFIFYLLEQ